jgi:hypothetical protein
MNDIVPLLLGVKILPKPATGQYFLFAARSDPELPHSVSHSP